MPMCYEDGILQAWIDGELDGIDGFDDAAVAALEAHVQSCIPCRTRVETLRSWDEDIASLMASGFAAGINTNFKSNFNDNFNDQTVPDSDRVDSSNTIRRFPTMIRKHQRFVAAAAAVVIAAGVLTFQPAMADQFLKLFRQSDIQTVSITQEDLNALDEFFSKGEGTFEFNDMAKVESSLEDTDITTLEKGTSMEVLAKYPEIILPVTKEGEEFRYISQVQKQTVTFTFDTEKVNKVLETLGESAKLPESVNGKPITFRFGDAYNYSVRPADALADDSSKGYTVSYSRFPQIEIPEEVDDQALFGVLNALELIPNNLKQQLASLDLKSTIPVPYSPEYQTMEEVTLSFGKGIIIKDKAGNYADLFFKKGDLLFSINGSTDTNVLIEAAEAFK